MQKTSNYNLPVWDAGDRVLRTDFNDMTQTIDTAIAAAKSEAAEGLSALAANVGSAEKNARITWGTYTGTGTYGKTNPTSLNVGFYPVLAVVGSISGAGYSNWPTILIRGCTASQSEISSLSKLLVTWSDSTIQWYNTEHAQAQVNDSSTVYYYCVIGYDKSTE